MSTKYIASNWRLPNKAGVDSYLNDNYGLTFDGNELIDCGNNSSLNITSTITLSAWVKPTTAITSQNFPMFVAKGINSDYMLFANSGTGTARMRLGASYLIDSVSTISTDVWTHVVGTYDGSNLRIYLNGVLDNTVSQTGAIPSTSGNLQIGAANAGNKFTGNISEIAVFDYALSSTQISTLYGSSSLGSASPLALKPAPVAFYPLGDNSSGNPLTQPNEAVEDASVFDFEPSETITTANPFTSIVTGSNVIGICTISYWLKVAGGSQQSFMELVNSATHTAGFRIDSNNKPYYINSQGGRYKRFAALSNPSNWNHWCWIFPSDTSYADAKLYINGVEKSVDFDFSTAPANNAWNGFYINKFQTGSSATFQMSNLQLWSGNLSESEVTTLYNSGVPLTGTQPQASNLKAWYKLDQSANWDVSGSGYWDIPDASGNGNDGISSGMTSASLVLTDLTRNLPYDSYSFNFDTASTDYIDCGQSLNTVFQSAFSYSVWINFPAIVNAYHSFFSAGYPFQCYIFQGAMKMWLSNSNSFSSESIPATSALTTNTWHNIVMTRSGNGTGNTVKIYVNGELEVNFASNVSVALSTSDLTIGAWESSSGSALIGFDGKISNVSLFNEELTSTEVLKLYSNGMPQDLSSFTPAPIAWWTLGSNSFFNGSNFICKDLIGSNDGTSVNAGVDALVGNTPRSEANGTGTNNSIPENLVGTTKYSSNNSWSINMSESARVADTP